MDSVKWLEGMVLASKPLENPDGSYRISRPQVLANLARKIFQGIQVKSLIISRPRAEHLSAE